MIVSLPHFKDLPTVLPVFPLEAVILLPETQLSLQIFEPRYLEMFDAALRNDRLIGVIQLQPGTKHKDIPTGASGEDVEKKRSQPLDCREHQPSFFKSGCVGRITSFSETDEGTYQVVLTGIIRFQVIKELELMDGYRRVCPDFSLFKHDLDRGVSTAYETSGPSCLVSETILDTIQRYFDLNMVEAEMETIRLASLSSLINTLAMSCPFSAAEKQALLQALDFNERLSILVSLMEMACANARQTKFLN